MTNGATILQSSCLTFFRWEPEATFPLTDLTVSCITLASSCFLHFTEDVGRHSAWMDCIDSNWCTAGLCSWITPLYPLLGLLPRWRSGKESACWCRRHKKCRFDPWVGKIPGEGNGNPLQYSGPEKTGEPGGLIHVCVPSHFSRIRLFVTVCTCGLPGSSVHGILHARILEWVAMAFSRPTVHGVAKCWTWLSTSTHVLGPQNVWPRCRSDPGVRSCLCWGLLTHPSAWHSVVWGTPASRPGLLGSLYLVGLAKLPLCHPGGFPTCPIWVESISTGSLCLTRRIKVILSNMSCWRCRNPGPAQGGGWMGGEGKKVARPDHLGAAVLHTSELQLRSHSQSSLFAASVLDQPPAPYHAETQNKCKSCLSVCLTSQVSTWSQDLVIFWLYCLIRSEGCQLSHLSCLLNSIGIHLGI